MQLNNKQETAVRHFKGPCLVIGTPGSGKTRVIVERIFFLVRSRGVSPSNILVITFTKAAAAEMEKRYADENGPGAGTGPRFGTFHSIFFSILKSAYNYTSNNILKSDVKRNILKDLAATLNLEMSDENEFLNDLESEIAKVKGEMLDLDCYFSTNFPDDAFKKIYIGYQKKLSSRKLIDFEDMLVRCLDLLSQRPDILKMWQKQYPYILIDEFQDINKIQYESVKLLAKPENNIFIVGDDDQSIYGFRGARPDIMKQFLNDYKDAKQIALETNYRCCASIVDAADSLIKNNKNRLGKNLAAHKKDAGAVEILQFDDAASENDAICGKILDYEKSGIPLGEIAVLFRTNAQARPLVSKLSDCGIPFAVKERMPNIYEHWIAADIFAYISAARGNAQRKTIIRIINRPTRYVGRAALEKPFIDLKELALFYREKPLIAENIKQLDKDLKTLSSLRPFSALDFIRRGIGYDDYIKEYADRRGVNPDDMLEILNELEEDAKSHKSLDEWFSHIKNCSDKIKKAAPTDKKDERDAVNILTMHAAKGLEYECVFIPDANAGIAPHGKAALDADIEEERRMFYVAMTRAKSRLHIYYLRKRFNREALASCFISEILSSSPSP